MSIKLPKSYKPTAKESYMNASQLEYFRRKLLAWRTELLEESQQTINHLREDSHGVGDEVDRANSESETSLELRTRDRYRKLLGKIDSALQRIEDGSYGYCEVSGEEIGLKRLEARPIASMTVEAQERHERTEGHFVDAR